LEIVQKVGQLQLLKLRPSKCCVYLNFAKIYLECLLLLL
jgi:hypothetical protein